MRARIRFVIRASAPGGGDNARTSIAEKRETGWRRNPRKAWYVNLQEVVVDAEDQVSFRLSRPQPSFLHFFAAAWSVVVPCDVDAATMRRRPIGTGPFMVKSIEPGKMIRLVKNPNYFKPGRPYLDGLDIAIMPGTRTRLLAFLAGDTDIYTPSATLLAEVNKKLPDAKCEVGLSYAFEQIPGYAPNLEKRQEEARRLMREAGFGPDKPLQLVLSTRDVQPYRDTSVLILGRFTAGRLLWLRQRERPCGSAEYPSSARALSTTRGRYIHGRHVYQSIGRLYDRVDQAARAPSRT